MTSKSEGMGGVSVLINSSYMIGQQVIKDGGKHLLAISRRGTRYRDIAMS